MAKLMKLEDFDMERDCDIYLHWQDCDLDAERPSNEVLKLEFEPDQSEKPFASDLFIIIEGNYVNEFGKQTLLNKDTIKICTVPTEYGVETPSVLLKYKNTLIAILETNIRETSEVAELLLPYAELAKSVVTLDVMSVSDYRSENMREKDSGHTIFRGINSKLNYVPELEAPNLITGVTGGVATWRAFKELPLSSYIAYTQQIGIDRECSAMLLRILRDLGLECRSDYAPKKREYIGLYT